MWYLHRFDKKNTDQHDKNMQVLSRVEKKVDRLDTKVDHLDNKVLMMDSKLSRATDMAEEAHVRVDSLEKVKPARQRVKSV